MRLIRVKLVLVNLNPINDTYSIEFLTICRIPGSPNLSKIEKVAENREFDGKETLIVKRAIAIVKRVLG